MQLNILIKLVKKTYQYLFNESSIETIKLSDNVYNVKFLRETIKVDNAVGNKYRLTFDHYEGTIDKFRDFYDEILKFNNNCCDTGYFIDLTTDFINKISSFFSTKGL